MSRKEINWIEVQAYYDSGKTIVECAAHFGFSPDTARKAGKAGLLKIRDKSKCQRPIDIDPIRINNLVQAYHSEKTWRELLELGFKQAEYSHAKDQKLLIPRLGADQSDARITKFGPNRPGVEARKALSIRQSTSNTGGRCKWFEVAGQKVQGTWERDFATELERRGIVWRKPRVHSEIIFYELDGFERAYTPDFYLLDQDLYIEVKGYWWGRDKEKMDAVINQHPEIKILIVEKLMFEEFMQGKQIW